MQTNLPEHLLPRQREPRDFTGLVRQCSLCRRTQPLSDFAHDVTKPHGHDQECRACNLERVQPGAPMLNKAEANALVEIARRHADKLNGFESDLLAQIVRRHGQTEAGQ